MDLPGGFESEAGAKRAGPAASMPMHTCIVRNRDSDWIWKFESILLSAESINPEEKFRPVPPRRAYSLYEDARLIY